MAKSYVFIALLFFAILPSEAALKGIVLWPYQARRHPELSAAISLEYSYALPCDVVSGTNSTGALVCDWSKFDSLLDDIALAVGGKSAAGSLKGLLPGESRVLFAKGAHLDGALTLVSKKLLAPIPLVRGE